MADELIDIVDENNNPTGEKKMKSEAHREGLWHRAAHIWIYNSKGEVLLQLRAKNKELWPDVWDVSAAGHVSAGEEPIISGLREIQEEIGLDVKKEDLEFYKIVIEKVNFNNAVNNEYHYVYFLKYDGDISKLKVQEEEVEKIEFLPIEEIRKGMADHTNKYFPHEEGYWEEILDAIEKKFK